MLSRYYSMITHRFIGIKSTWLPFSPVACMFSFSVSSVIVVGTVTCLTGYIDAMVADMVHKEGG